MAKDANGKCGAVKQSRSHKHRAEVIEIYENGAKAAVKFTSGRVECVNYNGTAGDPDKAQAPFYLGQKGMVDYVRGLNGWFWVFSPLKGDKAK